MRHGTCTDGIQTCQRPVSLHRGTLIPQLHAAGMNVDRINYKEREPGMNKKIKTDAVDHLFDAILTLKNPEECYKFFEDVCTINELLSLSQRYEVAKMLREGKTYLEIAEKTGASTATISRVNRSLNYGSDGYDMVFSRLQVDSIVPEKEDGR